MKTTAEIQKSAKNAIHRALDQSLVAIGERKWTVNPYFAKDISSVEDMVYKQLVSSGVIPK